MKRFSSDGRFVAQYGGAGRGDGQFVKPAGVAVDPEGYIYVADWGNGRVQVLDHDGRFVQKLRGEATHSKWSEDFLRVNVEEAEAFRLLAEPGGVGQDTAEVVGGDNLQPATGERGG